MEQLRVLTMIVSFAKKKFFLFGGFFVRNCTLFCFVSSIPFILTLDSSSVFIFQTTS